MPRRPTPPTTVREPLQVYLTGPERTFLDAVARHTGLSRAEVFRRALRRFGAEALGQPHPGVEFLDAIAADWPADTPADVAARHDQYLATAYGGARPRPRRRR